MKEKPLHVYIRITKQLHLLVNITTYCSDDCYTQNIHINIMCGQHVANMHATHFHRVANNIIPINIIGLKSY